MQTQTLLIISQSAGVLLLLSTVVLLFFRRVYLDAVTKEPIAFTLPIIGKVSTQAPVFALILVAAFLVIYPISRSGPNHVTLHGHIEAGGKHVSAIVVAVPDYQFGWDAESDDYSVEIPLLATTAAYRVMFIADKRVIDDQQALVKDGQMKLKPVKFRPPPAGPEDFIIPRKDVSDEKLGELAISNR